MGPVNVISEDLITINLALLGSPLKVLNLLPDNQPAVYAWHRNYNLPNPQKTTAQIFYESLLQEIYKPHSIKREAKLPPAYKLELHPYTHISKTKKDALRAHCEKESFRKTLHSTLENSILYSQPLYIGKSKDIKKRTEQHLAHDSQLRSRLSTANINISKCKLLINLTTEEPPSESLDIDSQDEYTEDINQIDEFDADQQNSTSEELVIEDILSRLFLPSFTIRYG